MILGVISDTHGDVERTTAAIEVFNAHKVSRILHCGDIGTTDNVRLFKGIPTDFVFGNSDPKTETLRRIMRAYRLVCHDWFGELEIEGKKIFLLHGHQFSRLDEETRSGNWDMICYGHTHVAELSMVGNTLLLNPGAIHRTPSPSVAIVELPSMNVSTIHIPK